MEVFTILLLGFDILDHLYFYVHLWICEDKIWKNFEFEFRAIAFLSQQNAFLIFKGYFI